MHPLARERVRNVPPFRGEGRVWGWEGWGGYRERFAKWSEHVSRTTLYKRVCERRQLRVPVDAPPLTRAPVRERGASVADASLASGNSREKCGKYPHRKWGRQRSRRPPPSSPSDSANWKTLRLKHAYVYDFRPGPSFFNFLNLFFF